MRYVFLLTVAACCVLGQSPAFDVVSIKPNRNMQAGPHRIGCTGGRFMASGELVTYALQWAYGLEYFQLAGTLPPWFADTHDTYDIEAQAAGPVSQSDCKRMLQTVFEDRFRLKFHRETREIPVYALTTGKSLKKMLELPDGGEAGSVIYNGAPPRTANGDLVSGWHMSDLAAAISGLPSLDGRPVVDRTGLQEQLGLRLEASKAPIEIFVIDHVERPSGN
jgi:uncharacterized protein (TIGR03435 family)